jgi:hypothetical protein
MMNADTTAMAARNRMAWLVFAGLPLAGCRLLDQGADHPLAAASDEIRIEATRANDDPAGRPLPLLCSWQCGHYRPDIVAGWRPEHQMQMIAEGHHLLPWFSHPGGEVSSAPDDFNLRYFKAAIARARELRLPLTFVASQWESGLSGKPYIELPAEQNPNVVTVEGKIEGRVSPFGPVGPWRQIGRTFTDNPWMKQIQEWYPHPPLVIFLSNNEHAKLHWTEVEKEQRYLAKYGAGRDGNFKRKVVGDGWIERYRALQDGLRQGLANDTWEKNSICVGYDAFGPPHFGRWGGTDPADGKTGGGWLHYSDYTPGRITAAPLMWDGGSPSYYTDDWNGRRDFTVWSPQAEFMNLVFMQREALKLNPKFWFEFSIWDGYHNDAERSKTYPSTRARLRHAGQTCNPERYAGMAQFGLWLMRPRAVRDFRGWTEPWADTLDRDGNVTWEGGGPYFLALAAAVDRVYTNTALRKWWRKGELVPNRARKHPYQAAIPTEYQGLDRWFALSTTLDPAEPWSLTTEIPVWALALVQGEAPERQWLIYAHSPLADRKDVGVTVPGHKEIRVDVPVAGAFYSVAETPAAVARLRTSGN